MSGFERMKRLISQALGVRAKGAGEEHAPPLAPPPWVAMYIYGPVTVNQAVAPPSADRERKEG